MQAVGIFAAMPTQAVPSPLAWRGEDFFRERPPRPYCGTPPRAWGGRAQEMGPDYRPRNTPTGVGRTSRPSSSR